MNSNAFRATLQCLSGCAVGEVLGLVFGTGFALSNGASIALSTALAFVFGYAFTVTPLLRSGMASVDAQSRLRKLPLATRRMAPWQACRKTATIAGFAGFCRAEPFSRQCAPRGGLA